MFNQFTLSISSIKTDVQEKKRKKDEYQAELKRIKSIYEDELRIHLDIERWNKQ